MEDEEYHIEILVRKVLSEIRPENDYSTSKDFINEGLLDSFDIVLLVSSLDEAFNISIDGTDIIPDNFSGVGKIVELVQSHKK